MANSQKGKPKIGHVEIVWAEDAKQCFVRNVGSNGRLLSFSENEKRVASAYKNIVATLKIYGGKSVKVLDMTQGASFFWIEVFADGTKGKKQFVR